MLKDVTGSGNNVDLTGVVKSINGITPDENGNVAIAVSGGSGTGLSATEKNLMLALFKAVPYQTDVSKTFKSLEMIWTSSSGSGDTPNVPDITNYTVTYNLTSVTADSTPASVVEGGSLTVNLTPDTNAVLGEVVVTMGGVDVTATAYSNGKISISSVTGNVIITATATVASYTQVEYLEANNTTYSGIVTDYTPTKTDLVECEFSCTTHSAWVYLFSWSTSNATCALVTRFDGAKGRTSYTRGANYSFVSKNTADAEFVMPVADGSVYRFAESEPGTATIYDSAGNAIGTFNDAKASGCIEPGSAVGLFCWVENGILRANSSAAGLRIHSFKIKNAYGETTLDLIPVLDADNAPCMYDKVSGKYFYCPNGNEYFTAGGAV